MTLRIARYLVPQEEPNHPQEQYLITRILSEAFARTPLIDPERVFLKAMRRATILIIFGGVLSTGIVRCRADTPVSDSICGTYQIDYHSRSRWEATQNSLEGVLHGGESGPTTPFVKIEKGKFSKQWTFLFIREGHVLSGFRVDRTRNKVQILPTGVDFWVYSKKSQGGAATKVTSEVSVKKLGSGDVHITVTRQANQRSLWVFDAERRQTIDLDLRRVVSDESKVGAEVLEGTVGDVEGPGD